MSLLSRLPREHVRRLLNAPSRRFMRSTAISCSTSSPTKTITMADVNDLFAEARLSLQDAVESKGTVYFEDDFEDAKKVTEETLQAFKQLCCSVDGKERQSLVEANNPKMAQLEQEYKNLEHELIHDD